MFRRIRNLEGDRLALQKIPEDVAIPVWEDKHLPGFKLWKLKLKDPEEYSSYEHYEQELRHRTRYQPLWAWLHDGRIYCWGGNEQRSGVFSLDDTDIRPHQLLPYWERLRAARELMNDWALKDIIAYNTPRARRSATLKTDEE